MGSLLQEQSSRVIMNSVGIEGSNGLFPLSDALIVNSTNMKVGAYTVAAQPKCPATITILTTAVTGADTQGTVTIVGTDATGSTITEVMTPISGTTVYSTNLFASVTSVTGAGWVINTGNDTIKIGVTYRYPPAGSYIFAMQIIADAVVTSQTNVSGAKNPTLSAYTSIPAGTILYGKFASIVLTSGEVIVYYATR